MNILFLSLTKVENIEDKSIYMDLMHEFSKNGHKVYSISPIERRDRGEAGFLVNTADPNLIFYRVKIGNITKVNLIEKALSTVTIGFIYKKVVNTVFKHIKFDLILYATPPITLCNVIEYVKKRDNAKTYLLLKDIFPQNAVDIGMMSKTGIMSFIYKYFRRKEKKLYRISDYIGCMSMANKEYILSHNEDVVKNSVEICHNSIKVEDLRLMEKEKKNIRKMYNLPQNIKIFVYGGNLGKPQGIPFLKECLKAEKDNTEIFFLIVGNGTEYNNLRKYLDTEKIPNVRLMNSLPKEEYDRLVAACDIGLIFLDYRFTIPNFPSRLLSYMQAGLPVFACTDSNTDIGKTIVEGRFGWWCESKSVSEFSQVINEILLSNYEIYKKNSFKYLCDNYNVEATHNTIMKHMA